MQNGIRNNRRIKKSKGEKDHGLYFCKLANGEIPTATLYEDDEFRVILDQGPATKGHALILPKQHFANIYEIPDETAAKAMILGKKWRRP